MGRALAHDMGAQLLEYDGAHLTAGGEDLGEAADTLGAGEDDSADLFERALLALPMKEARGVCIMAQGSELRPIPSPTPRHALIRVKVRAERVEAPRAAPCVGHDDPRSWCAHV